MAITYVTSTAKSLHFSDCVTDAIDTTGCTLLVIGGLGYFTITASDSKSNTWTPLTLLENGIEKSRMWYCVNPTVGTNHTFTFGNGYQGVAIGFSGQAASPFDQWSGAVATQPGSITPSEDNCVLVTFAPNTANTTIPTVNSGFTSAATSAGSTNAIAVGYKIQTTAGAENPTWTNGSHTQMASFKAGGAAPTSLISFSSSRKAMAPLLVR